MKNMKKIIVSVIAILLVVSVACTTYATDSSIMDEINEMLQQEGGNMAENEATDEIPEGTNNTITEINTNTNTNTNKNVNENRPETTPHAGLEDYSGLVFVAVFAVAAIYAYKKVKEYNV